VLVEAAVVFPLLLLVAIALVQFAVYQHAQNVVTAAAEDGARVAASLGSHSGDGARRAATLVRAGLGTSAENLSIVPVEGQDQVIVTVSARMRMILPWVPLADPYLPLHAQAHMSKERFRGQP
jgi:Flp pilus assembly protein TadG